MITKIMSLRGATRRSPAIKASAGPPSICGGNLWVLILLGLMFGCQPAFANNLNISNVSASSQDTTAKTVTIQFDISWDNSWYDSINKDACWVFVKYSTDAGTTWVHATMQTSGTNPSGTSTGGGTGTDVVVSQDKKGCFIQRSSQGSGSLSETAVQIVWDYGADGVSDNDSASQNTQFKVFGIEMVYIPQGGYYLGDGNSGSISDFQWSVAGVPGAVNSETNEMQFTATLTANSWYYTTDNTPEDDATGTVFTVSSSFPKGYAAFYCMKYEITEGQYCEFYNILTSAQQGFRNAGAGPRLHITYSGGVATTNRSDRGLIGLSWSDLCAYADWSALRPMSELEFEKACRGPIYPVAGEYAWGSTSVTISHTISGTEDGTETMSGGTNANIFTGGGSFTGGDGGNGALRAGIFATGSTTTRVATGGSYYGIMELSGNAWERCATIGNSTGRGFSGSHGDGVLTTIGGQEGNATNLDWPGLDSGNNSYGVTGALGAGMRGGSWESANGGLARLPVSDRYLAGHQDSGRLLGFGGRCVRTASA